jgi:hypothetical protein
MAVVRDANGIVQERFSQDTPVEAKERNLEALRHGNAVFVRTFRLPPGRYTLEVVAADQRAKRASVRKSVLVVPAARATLGLSSLAVVKRLEPVAEGSLDSPDPLRMGSNRIVPFVAEPAFKAGDTVSLFFVAYPQPGTGGRPSLTLEFAREGTVVGRSSTELPEADPEGRIPYIASVATQTLAPGRYEVAAVARQGEAVAQEHTFFTVTGN